MTRLQSVTFQVAEVGKNPVDTAYDVGSVAFSGTKLRTTLRRRIPAILWIRKTTWSLNRLRSAPAYSAMSGVFLGGGCCIPPAVLRRYTDLWTHGSGLVSLDRMEISPTNTVSTIGCISWLVAVF
ncbi:hypothetical protein TNCV_4671111 [Trichonephila clavipes]|nr:hypothetical protein TNCV_4671111 [Trichonephila clavipes]